MKYQDFNNMVTSGDLPTHPHDIANALSALSNMDRDNKCCDDYWRDLADALYDLRAEASNEYNSDYTRTFYAALVDITNRYDLGYIKKEE